MSSHLGYDISEALLDAVDEGVLGLSPQGLCLFANNAAARLFGVPDAAALEGRDLHQLVHHSAPGGPPLPLSECRICSALQEGRDVAGQGEIVFRADGSPMPIDFRSRPLRSRKGDMIGVLVTFSDASWRHAEATALRESETKFRKLYESLREREREIVKLSYVIEQNSAIVLITDLKGRIEYVNPKFEESTGFSANEVLGQNPRVLKSGLTPPEVYADLWATLKRGRHWSGELQNRRRDGSLYWEFARIYPLRNDDGEITHYVAVKEDITNRKQMEQALYRQTYYDALTGLPNRLLAFQHLSECIAQARNSGVRLGLLLVNVDFFSRVNSEIGIEAGDRVLTEVARRLSACCGDNATLLARVGGDRFLIAVEGFRFSASLELAARSVLTRLREPFDIGPEVVLSGTIGIAVYPNDGIDVEGLVRNAEAAVQHARRLGRNTYRFFIGAKDHDRSLRMDFLLQGALERNELFLEYQPIVAAGTGQCRGAEALIRWESPELGRVGPGEFVPLFEDCELAHPIGGWILDEALARLAEWRRRRDEDLFISVNVSPRQLTRTDFVDRVAAGLRANRLEPHLLKLEITERLFVEGRPEVLGVLEALDELGVILTLDDFGTGYSALGSLHKLPIRGLKIDRSFVERIAKDSREAAIVRSIQHLCRQMDIVTVAEGIETREQAESLDEIGIDFLQGYLFSRPLPWRRLLHDDFAPL